MILSINNSQSVVKLNSTQVARSLICPLGRSQTTDDSRIAVYSNSNVRIIPYLEHTSYIIIEEIAEYSVTMSNVVQCIAFRYCEIELVIEGASFIQLCIVVIQIVVDLLVLVFRQSSLSHGHDLSNLASFIQSSDVLYFFRANGRVDSSCFRNLYIISIEFPLNGALIIHSISSIQLSSQHNFLYITLNCSNSNLVVVHSTKQSIFQSSQSTSCICLILNDYRLGECSLKTITITIGRCELDIYMIPYISYTCIGSCSDLTLVGEPAIVIRQTIAFSKVYTLNKDTTNMSRSGQFIHCSATKSTNNISCLIFRNIDLHVNCRSGSFDSIKDLVLLIEHIDFLAISRYKDTTLYRYSKARLSSGNTLDTTTLREYVVHKDILMNRNSHTNHRRVLGLISIFLDTLNVVLKQLIVIFLCFFQVIRSNIRTIGVNQISAEEFTQSFRYTLRTQSTGRLLIKII